jgi:hypothetical protein
MKRSISDAEPSISENDRFLKFAELGLLLPIGAGAKIPVEFAQYWKVPCVKAEEWDGFYDMIMWDELYRDIWGLPSGISGVVRRANECNIQADALGRRPASITPVRERPYQTNDRT